VARGSRSPVGIHMGLSRAAACSRKGENGQAKRHPMAAGSTGPRQEPSLDVWGDGRFGRAGGWSAGLMDFVQRPYLPPRPPITIRMVWAMIARSKVRDMFLR
jgi:hypothetical protein